MIIAHITPYMHPAAGGPPVVVDRLSRELAARGHDVRVLTTDLFANGDAGWMAANGRPYALDVFPAAWPRRYAYSRGFSAGIRDAVNRADVVHIHTLWTYASLAAARACRTAGVPYLIMPHGMLDPHSVARGWWKKQVYGRLVEWPQLRAAHGMCYTHPEEERLARETCPELPPGHLVELGAEEPPPADRSDLRREFLQRHPTLAERRLVLFLGRIHAKKGLDLLIPAFETVAREVPDAHLLLVGPGEPAYVQTIRREIAARRLDSYATLTGPLYGREKWAAMAASSLFVLPSYQENFALAAVDALRGGLPVVLSRRVNLWQDLVAAGAARPCDLAVESVAAEIGTALADQGWRTSAIAAGEKLLETRFNWKTTAARVEALYADLVTRQ
jgi:glycosyltransferase involved in cell wall biosynthesis